MTIRGRVTKTAIALAMMLTILLVVSCGEKTVFTGVKMMPPEGWSIYNQVIFPVSVTDTLNPNDVLLTIRNNSEYPYRNIFLFVTTTSPQGYSLRDTVEIYLADEKGAWQGKGLGDIHDLTFPLRTNVIFPYQGTYQFRIEQGMRTEDLAGIMDVGLRIVKKEK
ncbi:MAG: gliding motility lipoprotein GldH [Bacteroidales bacterium]